MYGQIIRKIRKNFGLNTRDFGKKVGISYSYIAMLEKEKSYKGKEKLEPPIEKFKQICDKTGYPFRQFLEEAEYIEKLPVETESLTKYAYLFKDIDLSNVTQEHLEKALIAFRNALQDLDKIDN